MSAKEALIWDICGGKTPTEAARDHGVDRSCAYKWWKRFRETSGVGVLEERSRRPENSPSRTPQRVVDELLELKNKHPLFGPAKLVKLLEQRHGERVLSASTAGTILDRHGLVKKYGKRHPSVGQIERSPYEISGSGDSMTADFKGQFRTGDGGLCYPLTIADPFSRFVLGIVALPSMHMKQVKSAFERIFREYGVPRQMITDNGTPFCGVNSLGGLTQLSRWWIELGTTPVRIAPGRPDQNGIHERMHRTLKDWIRRYPRTSLRGQQRSFDAFRSEFNHVRPHQALGQKTPETAFKPYRPYSTRTAIEYDSIMDVRKVNENGEIKWNGTQIFTSQVLVGARIGLLQISDKLWSIHFGPVRIGYLDASSRRVTNRRPDDVNIEPFLTEASLL